MSSLICFPNKLVRPDTGVCSEFEKPGVDEKGVDFMGASCFVDPGSKAVGECGKKRKSDSLWASEDLSGWSEMSRDTQAGRGSPEWIGAADSHRAISLDASECPSETSTLAGTSLVRSAALEDLTSIGDRSLWVIQGKELVSEPGLTADGADLRSYSDKKNITSETQQSPDTQCSFNCHLEDLHQAQSSMNVSEKEPYDIAAESNSDSLVHRASHSESGISNDSEMRSSVVQTTGTAELQKTSPQSAPARKSLVPVAIVKGLFVVIFTS